MAFFCFRRKFPWTKTNYNCREAELEHDMRMISKTGAVDEDHVPYGRSDACSNGKSLDKYGIDMALDGSLKRSKKKKKKQANSKAKAGRPRERGQDRERDRPTNQEELDRALLPGLLDNATIQSPVCISVRLVHDFVSCEDQDFKVLKGETVIARFRKEDKVFVQCFNGTYGFVPTRFCYLIALYPATNFLEDLSNLQIPKNAFSNSNNEERDGPVMSEADGKENSIPESPIHDVTEQNALPILEDIQSIQTESVMMKEQNESDSLARRIKKHEIRQLLKREASKTFMKNSSPVTGSSDHHGSCDLLEKQNEPIRNGSIHSRSSFNNLSRERSSQSVLQTLEGVPNDYVPSSVRSSVSSLVTSAEPNKVKRQSQQNYINLGESRNDGILRPVDDDFKDSLSSISYRTKPPFNNGILSNQGYFFNCQNEALFEETELRKAFDSNPRQIVLRNRRCTSLRKITNLPLKPPVRANSLRYPSLGAEIGVYPREMITNGNGSLPRTPGSIRVLNSSELQESSNASFGRDSSYSLIGNGTANNSTHLYNGVLNANDSIQLYKGGINDTDSIELSENIMVAVRDFISSSKDDLSFAKGEHFLVIRKDSEGWWWVKNSRGQEGFVPCTLLTPRVIMGAACEGPKWSSPINKGVSCNRLQEEKENKLVSPGIVSLETQRLLESRLHWQKLYCEGNGRLAVVLPSLRSTMEEKKEQSSVESKEELLKRIRSEIDRDPVKKIHQDDQVTKSGTLFHRQTSLGSNFESPIGNVNHGLYNNGCRRDGVIEDGSKKKVYRSSVRLKLPSYTEYVDNKRRIHGLYDSDNHSQYSSSYSDVSNLDGSLCETPRVLRRRKTYSGASNKKVRFSQSVNGAEEDQQSPFPSKPCNGLFIEERLDEDGGDITDLQLKAEIATWC